MQSRQIFGAGAVLQCCSAGSAGNAMGCNILCPSFSEQFDAPGANFCTEPMGYQPPKTVMSPDPWLRKSSKVLKFGSFGPLWALKRDLSTCRLPSNTGVTLRSKAQNTGHHRTKGEDAKMRSSPVSGAQSILKS